MVLNQLHPLWYGCIVGELVLYLHPFKRMTETLIAKVEVRIEKGRSVIHVKYLLKLLTVEVMVRTVAIAA
jgi:hypothetical protein